MAEQQKELHKLSELQNKLDEQRQQQLEELGFKQKVELEEGENTLVFNIDEPVEEKQTEFGTKFIFQLEEPKEKVLVASEYLTQVIMPHILKDKKVVLIMMRNGNKVSYKVKENKDKQDEN